MLKRENELSLVEEKTEALISLATRKGADVDFRGVRRTMAIGRRYEIPRMFEFAIADLERGIAAANRESIRRSSRRPFVVKTLNLFKLW